jgi:lysophospholipase L1-like esterase
MKRWVAVGDSFTYLNDHLDETKFRVKKGYLTRTLEHLYADGIDLDLINIGINGSCTTLWTGVNMPHADLYTILLGTNDWYNCIPSGDLKSFDEKDPNTTLGSLGILIARMKKTSPDARIIVMNPVERGDFVYILDAANNAPNSTRPLNGIYLHDLAALILNAAERAGTDTLDLNRLSGFTTANAVKFKHVRVGSEYRDLPWPEYDGVPFDPLRDEYPYPPEAADMTYDGLHPSDRGCEIIAGLLATKMEEVLGSKN